MHISTVISLTLVACSAPTLAQCPAETDDFTSGVAQIVLSMSHNPATACTVATEAVGAGRMIKNEFVAGNISVDSVADAIDTALGNLQTFFTGNDTVEPIISSMIKMVDEVRMQADSLMAGNAKASSIVTGLSNMLAEAGVLAGGVPPSVSTSSTSAARYSSILSAIVASMATIMSEVLKGASTGCISATEVANAAMQGADKTATLLNMVTGGVQRAAPATAVDLMGLMQKFQAFLQS
ncbi:hypothetical protein E8E14_012731 [Neopestalotiopsis sp. 37M]|nr:hypothetical protein E8E14_012731 [Neopestalotiopsis sp. 37M]